MSAAHEFRIALAHVPGYAAALDPLASIEASRGRLPRAIALEQRAVAAFLEPSYVAALGDFLRSAGRPLAAQRQFARVTALYRKELANGIRAELELARFRIDHDLQPRAATRLALRAHRSAPTIGAADVVAWGLARTGRCAEAKRYSRLALRLGTKDALVFFHRGIIERCLGNASLSRSWLRRALELDPGFSPRWAPIAARYAR
jgi:tetratricopeptide (TPR) repeat protein